MSRPQARRELAKTEKERDASPKNKNVSERRTQQREKRPKHLLSSGPSAACFHCNYKHLDPVSRLGPIFNVIQYRIHVSIQSNIAISRYRDIQFWISPPPSRDSSLHFLSFCDTPVARRRARRRARPHAHTRLQTVIIKSDISSLQLCVCTRARHTSISGSVSAGGRCPPTPHPPRFHCVFLPSAGSRA